MATVKAIKYGMKGDDVSNLQTTLKNAGYNIDVDGSFGPQTLAAVKQYQQKNGLDVDGMVGPQTSAKLFGGSSANTAPSTPAATPDASAPTPATTPDGGAPASAVVPEGGVKTNPTQATNITMPEYEAYVNTPYAESETVQQAHTALQSILAAQPGAYQSQWQGQIDSIINRILNREKFTYDVNSDALYQQYAEQYQRLGKIAMQDTMGQAAAMTGGYGNSYASTVGNQAYQNYLSQLNDKIPELYKLALDKYQLEGQEMYNQYGLLSDQEAQDYGRYQDSYNQWLAERDYATGRYDTESDRDYGRYWDKVNMDYQIHSDAEDRKWQEYVTALGKAQWDASFGETVKQNAIGNEQWDKSFGETQKQNAIGNQQWQQSFDENVKQNAIGNQQWEENMAFNRDQADIDNEYRETVRQDGIDSENRAYAREEVMAILAAGGTPSEKQLKVAGLTKKAAQAMVAVESGNEEEALKGVKSMSYPEMEEALSAYAEAGKYDLAESMIDHLYDAYMITDDEYKKMLARYTKSNGHTITDTTVATPTIPIKGNGGGGQAMIKY